MDEGEEVDGQMMLISLVITFPFPQPLRFSITSHNFAFQSGTEPYDLISCCSVLVDVFTSKR